MTNSGIVEMTVTSTAAIAESSSTVDQYLCKYGKIHYSSREDHHLKKDGKPSIFCQQHWQQLYAPEKYKANYVKAKANYKRIMEEVELIDNAEERQAHKKTSSIYNFIKNRQHRRNTEAKFFIEHMASSVCSGSSFNHQTAIDYILTIALTGSVSNGQRDARTPEERTLAYEHLESTTVHCHHCGVPVIFRTKSGFAQFSVDRTVFGSNGSIPYDDPTQVTVRSCLFCNKFFSDSNQDKRTKALEDLVKYFDPDYAMKVVQFFVDKIPDDEAKKRGVSRDPSRESSIHWGKAWWRQSQPVREHFKNYKRSIAYRRRGGKPPAPCNVDDIRDWTRDEMLQHLSKLGNVCVVTGIGLADIHLQLQCDRITNDLRYNAQDTVHCGAG